MSDHRFNLRLNKEAKRIMDNVKRGEKNKFINDAIKEKARGGIEKELLSELKNISSSLSIIAGCLQEITKLGGFKINQTEKIEETHEETEDKDVQKKLSDFVMKYVDF